VDRLRAAFALSLDCDAFRREGVENLGRPHYLAENLPERDGAASALTYGCGRAESWHFDNSGNEKRGWQWWDFGLSFLGQL